MNDQGGFVMDFGNGPDTPAGAENNFGFVQTNYDSPAYESGQDGGGGSDTGMGGGFGGAGGFYSGSFDDEPPLLEELGIDFQDIKRKSWTVLHPFRAFDRDIMDSGDLAGPFCFAILLGSILMMNGKVHFGFIYGLGVVGCLSMYLILNLMAVTGIDLLRTTSVLGYCLLPMVFLAGVRPLVMLNGYIGLVAAALSVLWCAHSASSIFVTVLEMKEQRWLVFYPVCLLYMSFALLTAF